MRKIFEARAELARRGHLTPKEPPGPDWIPEGVRPGENCTCSVEDSQRSIAPRPLLAEAQLLEDAAVLVQIRALEIVQQTTAPAYHLEQTTPTVMVLRVRAEMLG